MQDQNALHIILDIYFEHFPVELEDVDFWKILGNEALSLGSFSVMGSAIHKFEPEGMSGFWLLSESHLSFHTWPEEKRIFLDLFSCGDETQTKKTVDFLIKGFEELKGNVESRKDLKRGYVYGKDKFLKK
jgi:S-adenosylmethionine decarboxylase